MNRAPLLVLFALACLGFVGWLMFGTDTDPAPQITPPPAAAAQTQPAQPAAAARGDAAKDAAPTATPTLTTDSLAGERTAVAAEAAAADRTVTVRGRLVDRQGNPRAGVPLALTRWAVKGDLVFDMPPDRIEPETKPAWRTGADGRFALPIAVDHMAQLHLQPTDLVFATDVPTLRGAQGDQDLGDLRVLRAGALRGTVRDAAGQPVAGVKVVASRDVIGPSRSSTQTGDDGAFALNKLRPGRWLVRTASGKFLPHSTEVELGDEEEKTDLVLVLKTGNAIAGQVVDERGIGVPDMKVGCKRTEQRGGIAIERFAAEEATTTDPNGYFTLAGIAEETASVRAFGKQHSAAIATDVKVGTGDLVLRVERLGSIEGVLVDTEGKPIADSSISAGGTNTPDGELDFELLDGMPVGGLGNARTGADGTFVLDGVKPGLATVRARGKTHRPARQSGIAVQAAQTTKGIRLIADRGAVVRVTVLDDSGKPVAGAAVEVQRPQPDGGGQGNVRIASRSARMDSESSAPVMIGGASLGAATSDAQGNAEIAGLPQGDVVVLGKHADFAPADEQRASLARTGTTEATLRLRTPGRAEVTVLGADGRPATGAAVRLTLAVGNSSEPRDATTNDQGIAAFASLIPGEYRATLVRKATPDRVGDAMIMLANSDEELGSTARTLTIVAKQTAKLTLQQPVMARLHGVVNGVNGPTAGVVVRLEKRGEESMGLPGLGGRSERTGADGSYAFADVEAGAYTLRFGKADQLVKAKQDVDVPPATADVQQDLALRTGLIRARVVTADTGEPVRGAEVELVDAAAASGSGAPRAERRVMMVTMSVTSDGGGNPETTTMSAGNQTAKSDEDGLVEIEDVPAGVWKLRATHKKFSATTSGELTVVVGQATEAGAIQMRAAGQIRGKVLTADGKSPRMALVTHRAVGTQDWSAPEMAQNGTFRIGGLTPGKYQVRAQEIVIDGDGPGGYSPEVEVDVAGGETATTDLQLPAR